MLVRFDSFCLFCVCHIDEREKCFGQIGRRRVGCCSTYCGICCYSLWDCFESFLVGLTCWYIVDTLQDIYVAGYTLRDTMHVVEFVVGHPEGFLAGSSGSPMGIHTFGVAFSFLSSHEEFSSFTTHNAGWLNGFWRSSLFMHDPRNHTNGVIVTEGGSTQG